MKDPATVSVAVCYRIFEAEERRRGSDLIKHAFRMPTGMILTTAGCGIARSFDLHPAALQIVG